MTRFLQKYASTPAVPEGPGQLAGGFSHRNRPQAIRPGRGDGSLQRLALFGVALLALAVPARASDQIVLENAKAKVVILPKAAGRIVSFSRPGGKNFLKSNEAYWDALPQPETWTGEPGLHGQLHWVAPQKEWYNQQDSENPAFPQRKNTDWPPDPWSEVVSYEVLEHGNNLVNLAGPISPVTGLQMGKRYELSVDGTLSIEVTAVNQRTTPVTWGLWSVTRLEPDGPAFARVGGGETPRYKSFIYGKGEVDVAPRLVEGLFSFVTEAEWAPSEIKRARKAFITPPAGETELLYLRGREAFIKRFTVTEPGEIAPGHAPVEIFVEQHRERPGTLELEFHGACRTLAPGEMLKLRETWHIEDLDLPENPQRADWEAAVAKLPAFRR